MSTVYNFTSKEIFCWSLQIFILDHQRRAVEHAVLTATVQGYILGRYFRINSVSSPWLSLVGWLLSLHVLILQLELSFWWFKEVLDVLQCEKKKCFTSTFSQALTGCVWQKCKCQLCRFPPESSSVHWRLRSYLYPLSVKQMHKLAIKTHACSAFCCRGEQSSSWRLSES